MNADFLSVGDVEEMARRINIAVEQHITVDPDGTQHMEYTPEMLYSVFDDMGVCWICGARCIVHTHAQKRAAFERDLPGMEKEALFLKRTPNEARCRSCGRQLRLETGSVCVTCLSVNGHGDTKDE